MLSCKLRSFRGPTSNDSLNNRPGLSPTSPQPVWACHAPQILEGHAPKLRAAHLQGLRGKHALKTESRRLVAIQFIDRLEHVDITAIIDETCGVFKSWAYNTVSA